MTIVQEKFQLLKDKLKIFKMLNYYKTISDFDLSEFMYYFELNFN